VVIAATRQPA